MTIAAGERDRVGRADLRKIATIWRRTPVAAGCAFQILLEMSHGEARADELLLAVAPRLGGLSHEYERAA
jgi:hypothetical protein